MNETYRRLSVPLTKDEHTQLRDFALENGAGDEIEELVSVLKDAAWEHINSDAAGELYL